MLKFQTNTHIKAMLETPQCHIPSITLQCHTLSQGKKSKDEMHPFCNNALLRIIVLNFFRNEK